MAIPYAEFEREVIAELAIIRARENPNWPSWPEDTRDQYTRLQRGNVALHRDVRQVLQAVLAAEERLGLRRKP